MSSKFAQYVIVRGDVAGPVRECTLYQAITAAEEITVQIGEIVFVAEVVYVKRKDAKNPTEITETTD